METECAVCMEGYEAEGEKRPKLLPCSHTLCAGCVKQLTEGFRIQCPECRESHLIPMEDFPTNRYILPFLGGIKVEATGSTETEICQKHSRPCAFYCTDPKCLQMLCPQCPTQDHRDHKNLVGSFESLKDSMNHLCVEAADTVENLEDFVKKVEEIKETVNSAGETAKHQIHKAQVEAVKKLTQHATAMKEEVTQKVENSTRELDQMKEEAQHKTRVSNEILQAVHDFPDLTASTSFRGYTKLDEQLNTFKRQASDITATAPVAPTVHFVAGPLSAMGSLPLGSTRYVQPGAPSPCPPPPPKPRHAPDDSDQNLSRLPDPGQDTEHGSHSVAIVAFDDGIWVFVREPNGESCINLSDVDDEFQSIVKTDFEQLLRETRARLNSPRSPDSETRTCSSTSGPKTNPVPGTSTDPFPTPAGPSSSSRDASFHKTLDDLPVSLANQRRSPFFGPSTPSPATTTDSSDDEQEYQDCIASLKSSEFPPRRAGLTLSPPDPSPGSSPRPTRVGPTPPGVEIPGAESSALKRLRRRLAGGGDPRPSARANAVKRTLNAILRRNRYD